MARVHYQQTSTQPARVWTPKHSNRPRSSRISRESRDSQPPAPWIMRLKFNYPQVPNARVLLVVSKIFASCVSEIMPFQAHLGARRLSQTDLRSLLTKVWGIHVSMELPSKIWCTDPPDCWSLWCKWLDLSRVRRMSSILATLIVSKDHWENKPRQTILHHEELFSSLCCQISLNFYTRMVVSATIFVLEWLLPYRNENCVNKPARRSQSYL